ncbi:hypothetical protein PHYPSEUDO_003327 [Phytophthora pseudosyringae]|uniref:FYVE-type domain-containing protein n=1 Tax=Phytophthora pseudosyringae TaxID=221518 RepID=A0A8T1VR03_9STRA|nr:hypothetical protein PHYPSEUDO_003327 [Phytophthora pseudosyringae]
MKQEEMQDQPEALSPEETAALLSMSDSFIQEAVHMSRHYVGCSRHPSAIDPTRWKRIAHVRDLRMYKERRARWRLGSKRKLGSRLAANEYVDDSAKLLPATLLVGAFPGDLESVMFGLQSSTEDSTRLRASYLGDNLVDEKMLAAPLESPSYDNPLRSCTLRWRALRSGATAARVASGTIFSSRAIETVYIESTGITELGNGERVGYELLQSVEVPGFGGFGRNGRRQAIISYCYVYRQPSPDVMEVFMLGSTSRDGVLLGGALAKMHSLHRLVRCAERKKLAWLLNSSQPTLANTKAGGCCAECFRLFGRWPHRAERQCSACDERVCASCTAYRQMRFALPFRRKVTCSKLAFCGRCLQRADETSPLTVAAFEAMEQGEDLGFDTFDSSLPPLWNSKWSSQCLYVDDDLAMTILGD